MKNKDLKPSNGSAVLKKFENQSNKDKDKGNGNFESKLVKSATKMKMVDSNSTKVSGNKAKGK